MRQAYFRRATERCWKLYGRYYQDGRYEGHDARYRKRIMEYLTPDTCLLDAGCGLEMRFTREFSLKIRMVVGIDLEGLAGMTPGPYAMRGDLNHLPFKDSSFDIVITKSVIEHLLDPARVFHEVARVLRPSGVVILLTPNKYDYVSLIARVTPFWFHRWVLSRLLDRKEEDTFPTFYRANTRKQLLSLLDRSKLIPLDVTLFNQYPAYLMFSSFLFRLGVFYERVTSRYDTLANLRGWILAVAEKRDQECRNCGGGEE